MISWSWIWDRGALLVGKYSKQEQCCTQPDNHKRKKVAAFDLDSTLINTKSGKLHATDFDDWEWWHPSVVQKLRSLSSQEYQVVIFSNQGRLTTTSGSEAPEAELFKQKVASILSLLDISITLFAACANDIYRKPRIGMWEEMMREYGESVNAEESYLVGDSGGRDKDHSDSDVHFCENLGINFITPEEFFLGESGGLTGHKSHPQWYLKHRSEGTVRHAPPKTPELVVFVGLPGAGKTTYYNNVLRSLEYEPVNGHEGGSLEDHIKLVTHLLLSGKSVVIDDVNEDIEKRKLWVSVASKNGIPIRAFYFTTSPDLCLHNDTFRALAGHQDTANAREIYPRIAFRKLQAGFQPPEIGEGFSEVVEIGFEWRDSSDRLESWSKHWL